MTIWLASRLDGPEDMDGGGPKRIQLLQELHDEDDVESSWIALLDPCLMTKGGPVSHVLLMPRNPSAEALPSWIESQRAAPVCHDPSGREKWDHTYRVWIAIPRVRERPELWLRQHFDTVSLMEGEIVISRRYLFSLRVEVFTEAVERLEHALEGGATIDSVSGSPDHRRLARQISKWKQDYATGVLPSDYIWRLEKVPGWRWR